MRILALRGANIASLTEFDIDFRAEPLRSAGLFAIVGPTGSGKSSLLDAMCLALYQHAPRLDDLSVQEGKVETRFGIIAQADIRNLLRRGCDTGFAECDFAGSDGQAYRARWGYRAPKRANAAVQEVMSLVRLDDGQVLVDSSGRKGDYQTRIEALVGLTYSQFTRTILLAQGRFAEFLRGKENERADLLERLTGTGIYTRISVRVRERTAVRKLEAEQLAARVDSLSLLSPEEESGLRARHSALQAELPGRETRRDELRTYLDGCARLASLEAGLAGIRTRCAELGAACEAGLESSRVAQVRLSEALEARRLLLPQLEEARALDSRREALAGRHRLRQEAHALSRERRDAQKEQIRSLETQIAALSEKLATDSAWIEKHRAKLEPLANQWPLWRERLAQAATLRRTLLETAPEWRGLQEESTRCEQETTTLERELAALPEPAGRSEDLTRRLQRTQADLETHRLLLPWLECREEIGTRAGRLDAWQAEVSALETRTAELESVWDLAHRLWESTRTVLSASVSHLRATLVPDEACPVCGSTVHPWAEDLARPLDALLEEHARSEQDARQVLDAHKAKLLELSTRIRSEQDAQEAARVRLARLAPDPALLSAFPEEASALPALQEALAHLESRSRELLENLKTAQLHEALTVRLQQDRTRLETCRAQADQIQVRMEATRRDLETGLASLDAPFGSQAWRERWEGNEQFLPQVERSVADFLQRSRDVEEKRRQLEPLQGKLAAELEHLPPLEQALATALAELEDGSRELAALELLRQGVLGGRSVALAESLQTQEEERLRQEFDALRTEAQEHAQEKARWDGQLAQQQEQSRGERAASETLARTLFPLEDLPLVPEQVQADCSSIEHLIASLRQEEAMLEHRLAHQAEQVAEGSRLRKHLEELRKHLAHWLLLDEQIGSADGKKFRLIAQQFTLEILLEEANTQLRTLAPRYTLRMLGQSMHFGVIDHEGFDELRPVQTLSGGETFLVSLALALGLSRLAGGSVAVESLFIDEGFGTLDSETLRQVMNALSNLHAQGRKVGLITHVEEMKEQIPVQIRVARLGQGASRIEVQG